MNDDNHKTLQEFAMGEIIKELRAERDALKAELKATESRLHEVAVGCANAEFELEAARKQEPAVLIEGKKIFWNPEYKGVHDGGFYAGPVPAQQPEAADVLIERLWQNSNHGTRREDIEAAFKAGAANAQQPSIPTEHPLHDSMSSNHRSYAEGWNKCRAAMISGEPPAWANNVNRIS